MAILFQCTCGQKISVTDKKAGAEVQCPRCNKVNVAPNLPKRKSELEDSQTTLPVPTGKTDPKMPKLTQSQPIIMPKTPRKPLVGRSLFPAILVLCMVWILIGLIAGGILLFLKAELMTILAVAVAAPIVLLAFMLAQLTMAKSNVAKRKEVDLLFRMVKLVAWDPDEGIIIFKDKTFHYVDDLTKGGGTVTLFPMFGDRLLLRQPLGYQSLEFQDDCLFSRENMTLALRGSVDWRIADLERYHKLMTRDTKAPPPDEPIENQEAIPESKVESNKQWMRGMVEELARAEIVRIHAGALLAESIAYELNRTMTGAEATISGLAETIQKQFAEKARPFGIDVRKVTIESIAMPKDLRSATLDAAREFYSPIRGTSSYAEFIAYLNEWFANARKMKK